MLFSYPLYTTTYLPLLQLDRKGQTAQLVQQHVHCLGNTRLGQVVAFDDGLVSLGTPHHVIRLDGQDLLQDIGGAEAFERRMQFEQVAEGSVTLDEFVAQLSEIGRAHV